MDLLAEKSYGSGVNKYKNNFGKNLSDDLFLRKDKKKISGQEK